MSFALPSPTINTQCMMPLLLLPVWQIPNQNLRSSSSVNASLTNFPHLLRNVLFPSFVPLLFLNYSFIIWFVDQAIYIPFIFWHISLFHQTASHATFIFYIPQRFPKCLAYKICSINIGFLYFSSEENMKNLNWLQKKHSLKKLQEINNYQAARAS